MSESKHTSISRRLTRMNALVSGAALLFACSIFVASDSYNFRAATVSNLSTEGQIIGANTVSALVFDDPHAAETTLSALRASPHIVYAAVYTPDRQLLASYRRDSSIGVLPLPPFAAGTRLETHLFESGRVALVRSIIFQKRLLGFVYIRSDLQALYQRLRTYMLIAAVVFLVSLLSALVMARKWQDVISRPVVKLADSARRVSREKDYSIRVAETSNFDEVDTLIDAFNDMLGQIEQRDTALLQAQDELEKHVHERTMQLAAANKELEAFSYSVAHDLRAPLRSIDGFSHALLESYADKLDADGQDYLHRVRAATQRMSALIDDLLNLSRVNRSEIQKKEFDLSALAKSVAAEIEKREPERQVAFVAQENVVVKADARLLRVVLENLLSNAWKYTSRHRQARVEFGSMEHNGRPAYFVRDDGAGFDPRHAARLFGAFQRLHSNSEFPGTGIGLATAQRIIAKHGGEIWAEAALEKGATFSFTL